MRFNLCLILLATSTGVAFAQTPPVVRKPVVVYGAAKAEESADEIFKADLSPDGKLVACVRRGGRLAVYAVGQAKPLFTTEPTDLRGSPYVSGSAFSAEGKLLGFPGKGRRIEIVTARTGKAHTSLELPANAPETVDALAFAPGGRKLAVASGFLYHKDLYIFDVETGKLLGQPLKDVDGAASQLIFSGDGKRLVANHFSTIYFVDTDTHRLAHKVKAQALAVFFRGERLYAVQDRRLEIHEVTEQAVVKNTIGKLPDGIELASAARMAFAAQAGVAAVPYKAEVSIRNMDGRELFRVVGENSPIRRLCLSADGRVLLIYRDSLRVEVFDLK